jgi:hypothetical protein
MLLFYCPPNVALIAIVLPTEIPRKVPSPDIVIGVEELPK